MLETLQTPFQSQFGLFLCSLNLHWEMSKCLESNRIVSDYLYYFGKFDIIFSQWISAEGTINYNIRYDIIVFVVWFLLSLFSLAQT